MSRPLFPAPRVADAACRVAMGDAFLDESLPLAEAAAEYLGLLLRADRMAASRLVLDLVGGGAPVRDVYLNIFQASQYELGRLWQLSRVSVAQEHYCTAATQLIMAQLYPHVFGGERNGRRLVAACVGGELHELGVRMVADFFEMAGWDAYYLGANCPLECVLAALRDHQADVLALSATLAGHVPALAELIRIARDSEAGKRVKILAGGWPFLLDPELWRKVGADGWARDAEEAVALAETLCA